MVIRRVGSVDVTSVEQFRDAIAEKSLEDGILMLVSNGDASRFVVLRKS